MTGIESGTGLIDTSALWSDLQELEAGTLDPERRDALMALLGRSPGAQTAYLEYFEMAAMLEAEASTHAERGKLPVVGQSQLPLRFFRRSLLAAAAALAIGAIVASLFIVKTPKPLLAEATENAVWAVDGAPQENGSGEGTVAAGSTVHVRSGTLRLGFESGASMVIQSPASVYFPELDKPRLKYGWLWIDSENSDDDFEVATPDLLIRDIGTRFAVRVPDEGPAEVHLIKGKVEVVSRATGEEFALLEPEGRGVAVETDGETSGLELARDPFPELEELLAAPENYATTVSGQSPAGYWRMEDGETGTLANEIPGETVGRRHPAAVESAPGPGSADGFNGFGEDNRSVRLLGRKVRAPVSLGATPVHDGLLFRENLDGKGPLHDTVPDVQGIDRKWIAAPAFGKDGKVSPGSGSATLAFSPVDGVVYTLDASLRDLTGSGSWVALGFANGQSREADPNNRFINRSVVGRAWMLARGNGSDGSNQAFLGASGTNGGVADGAEWNGALANLRGDLDLRVVLDTSAGPGAWEATWYAKGPYDKAYSKVRDTKRLINEEIGSVGLAVNGARTTGRIAAFSLRADRSSRADPEADLANAPANLSRGEGAVSFWMRHDPGAEDAEIIWTAGESPSDRAIQALLEPDGRIGLFMENGRFDLLLTSENSVADGRWHHVVSSWNASSVDLYIDGRMVARTTEFRGMRQGVLSEMRFGSGVAASGSIPFTGWIDEVAFWNRAMTPVEVLHQFRSAQGGPDAGSASPAPRK